MATDAMLDWLFGLISVANEDSRVTFGLWIDIGRTTVTGPRIFIIHSEV